MSLMALQAAVQTLGGIGFKTHGVGYYMVLTGFGILAAILVGALTIGFVRFVKRVGDMSPGQFIIFMATIALGLIIVGTLMPA
ncbi:MAG: hypothetical protein F7B59_00385 [Desulfurococcales archaeon]|nr:hypothetical protein [Desulfurococcales archaeon]